MTDTIFIKGVVVHARHGVMEHETRVGQRFVIDLELYTDLSESSRTDRLADTVSYSNVVATATSAFKGTNLHEMLASLEVDTLIVTGVSTSHCVYATCRDATDSYRVIVPREAVGERCELFHEVNLLDIDLDLGDVMPVEEVIAARGVVEAERNFLILIGAVVAQSDRVGLTRSDRRFVERMRLPRSKRGRRAGTAGQTGSRD